NLPESFSVEDVEAEYNFPSKGKRILSILISKINFGAESLTRIIVYFKDITREGQEKEELQNKIKFSQAIIEALPQIAWTSGLDNTVNYFNKRWEEYTGQSLEDGKGKGWVKMVHPEDVSKAIAIYKGNKAENREAEAEIRLYYAKEKIFRWNIVRVRQVMKDYGGAPLYVGVTTDIHHEKMAYSKIQDILLDSQVLGKIGSYELDFLNDKITWTPQTYKIYGFKPDQEVTIEEILSRIHPKDREIFQKTIQDSIENGTSYEMEYDLLFPDKSGKKLLSRGKVYNGDDGKPARLVGTLIDITNRKEREEKLENMQTLLLESQALSHTGSFEWDLLTNHVHWTPELYAICGIPPTERITFETHTRYIHPEDLQGVLRQFDEAYINPGPFKNEFRIVRTDNSQRYVSSEAIVICDDNNKPAKVLGTLHDLTERRKIEEELSEANQELEKKVKERTLELLKINEELKKANADSNTFVYTASHDLKAPISNIEGLIRALQEEVNLNENLTTIFDMLHAAIDNFKHNLQDLAAIGKAQAEGNLKESSVSFEDVFHAVHTDLQENIMQSRAEINYDFSKAPEIKMASKNLRSIFYNTISNAIKYKHPDRPPVIHIYSEDFDDDHFLLSIQDNGMGIKEEDKEKLFILYTRIHEHVQGTGVGLAIVKRIIENHGGWIEVESEPGKGATFNIYIKK
ncbi:MAG: PAS domain-containing protein, partial [Cytophagaceae bacterium]